MRIRANGPSLAIMLVIGLTVTAEANITADKVHTVDTKKTNAYIDDGLFVGGDQAVDDVIVRGVRRAPNPGYERIVIDLEGNRNGEPLAIPRPPFYQVAVTPEEKRIVFTIWGKPKLDFDSRKVVALFKKSKIVKNIQLFPRLDEDTWIMVLELKGSTPVEVFELTNPVRIISDIRTDKVKN
ncbi:MAG: hypothetical protein A3K03_02610 [Bdellovibrionales bacterium RIFOXYD1_FULL_44_7]|nr:MAG: hypothetical protein A3K03_02610 [Bdellovibrionales bacterium RIFOXYD1_FULL_44_7]